jgi:SNF2 family DNA or RNA helicase
MSILDIEFGQNKTTMYDVVNALSTFNNYDQDEKRWQEMLEIHFQKIGRTYEREVHISKESIIDFKMDRIGIELKTKGRVRDVYRQIKRYLETDEIDEIVLLTTKNFSLPSKINGKTVRVINKSFNILKNQKSKNRNIERDPGTYGTIVYSSEINSWKLDVDANVSMRLKRILDFLPKTSRPPFIIKNTPERCADLNWVMTRYPLTISKKDHKFLNKKESEFKEFISSCDEILMNKSYSIDVDLTDTYKLRSYQSQYVGLAGKVKRIFNADDTGLGKTLECLAHIVDVGKFPVVICSQTTNQIQWFEEASKATNLKIAFLSKGKLKESDLDADIYITRYSLLAKHMDYFLAKDIDSIHFDEIQELRNSGSDKYNAAYTLSQFCNGVTGYSATPIYNRGSDVFNIYTIIDKSILGSWSEFSRDWCINTFQDDKGDIKDPVALRSYLIEINKMIRRTREDVQLELPPLDITPYLIEHDKKEIDRFESLLKDLAIKTLESKDEFERGRLSNQLDMKAREMTGISKARTAAAFIRDLIDQGRRPVVVGWHREVWNILSEELSDKNLVFITGNENPKQKDLNKKKFINDEADALCVSIRSCVGIDGLQEASSDIVFIEFDWSPAVHKQVIERLWRFKQRNTTSVYYLIAEAGTDPAMIEKHGVKKQQLEGFVNGEQLDENAFGGSKSNRPSGIEFANSILKGKKK